MAIQIDIKKAFDTMNLNFIVHVLKNFEFTEQFCKWISIIFKSLRISVLFNGLTVRSFQCSRSVRKGNHLCPFHLLRTLATTYPLYALLKYCNLYTVDRDLVILPHLIYTNDVMLFCKASKRNVETLKSAFDLYENISRQSISVEK